MRIAILAIAFSLLAGACDTQLPVVKLSELRDITLSASLRPANVDAAKFTAQLEIAWTPGKDCSQLPANTKVTMNGMTMSGSDGYAARGGSCYYPLYTLGLAATDLKGEGNAEIIVNDGSSTIKALVPLFLSSPTIGLANATALERGKEIELGLMPKSETATEAWVRFFGRDQEPIDDQAVFTWRSASNSAAERVSINADRLSVNIPIEAPLGAGILKASIIGTLPVETCEGATTCEAQRITIRLLSTEIVEASNPLTAPTIR